MLSGVATARVLTLDDCIEIALKRNNDVIRAHNNARLAGGTIWQAFGAFLPSFSISASAFESHSPENTSTQLAFATAVAPGDPITINDLSPIWVDVVTGGIGKSYNLGGNLTWVPFNGGRNIFNYFGSRADKRYFDNLAESSEQNMIFFVKSSYFSYLQAVDKKKIAEEAVRRGEEQFKLANSKYEVGSASKSDVLKAKVQYGNDKLQLITEENNVEIAKADLLYLIGLNVNAEVEISEEYEQSEYDGTQEDAMSFGMNNHPGLLAAQYNMKAAKYDYKSTLGRFLPTWTVNLSKDWYSNHWSEVTKLESDNSEWTISSTVSWPIFEGFSKKRDITRARTVVSNARASLQYAENNVALDIKKAYLDIKRAKEALIVAESNVEAAEEDMSLVREKYKLGAATILEVLDAQVSLIQAQNSRVEADFAYSLATAQLEKAMGVR
jgi:outer membrane protein TolC